MARRRTKKREAAVGETTDSAELRLYADNDRETYRLANAVTCNQLKKWLDGKFRRGPAVKGWQHVADYAAQRYDKEFGTGRGKVDGTFTKTERTRTARALLRHFMREVIDIGKTPSDCKIPKTTFKRFAARKKSGKGAFRGVRGRRAR